MGIRHSLKTVFEKATGLIVLKKYPFGCDPFQDITQRTPGFRIDIILDVGANIGQSAKYFSECFPNARIYSFEPAKDTYAKLVANVSNLRNVETFNYAMGNQNGTGYLLPSDNSLSNKVIYSSDANQLSTDTLDAIQFIRLDEFCEQKNISRINYLKIDTEGKDLDVLMSGENMLTSQLIDYVEVEVGMHPENTDQVPFESIKSFMESRGYYMFGIYQQVGEWKLKKRVLRRVNALFIARKNF